MDFIDISAIFVQISRDRFNFIANLVLNCFMIVYNTTFHVDDDILSESIEYLKQEFIPSSTRSGILSHPLLQRVLQDSEAGTSLCVQFRVKNQATLHEWIRLEGIVIQQKLVERFGSKMAGFSTLLDEIDL